MNKITSEDVRRALKLRFPADSHALLFEVANATGAGQRRFADAVAVGLWPSHGHLIEGVEIKVSRSDFLNEMKNPGKSQPVFQHCHRWWLACPKDMVKAEELPPTWGMLELCGDTLRTKVKAPPLEPVPLSIGFLAALVRRHAGLDEDMTRLALNTEVTRQKAEIQQRLEREYRERFQGDIADAKRAKEAWAKVKEETGIDLTEYGAGDELVKAIRVVQALNHGWRGSIEELHRAAASIVQTIDQSGLMPATDQLQPQ